MKNEAIRRDILNFWSWQHQKRNNSARHPSIMESWVQSWRPCANAFCDFSAPCLYKVLRLPRKSDARSYEVLHLSHKITLANLKIWCSKMHPVSGNQHPDLNISDEHVSCTARARQNASLQILFKCPTFLEMLQNPHVLLGAQSLACHAKRHLNVQKCSVPVPVSFSRFWLGNVLRATTACTFSTPQLPKVVRDRQFSTLLTSKCALRHNG